MTVNRNNLRRALRAFDFHSLFIEELGWDRAPSGSTSAVVDGTTYLLVPVAHKRGMVVFLCSTDDGIPNHSIRRKIDREATKSAHEHIIVYIDSSHTNQIWQWIRREPGKPAALRQHVFHRDQPGDSLIQRLELLAFDLDQEENLTISNVAGRARQAFDVDRVTKKFYERFTSEHESFLDFIKGIQGQGDREWYASLMLNRLMFTYFIQKKGFLDGDIDYLRNRLRAMREGSGSDKFHSFYRYFLLRLFHEGLGKEDRVPELDGLLGRVPYLNGGLFDVHMLEQSNSKIEIADEAFERIFDFFDSYQWHLDERPLRADNEINPDVLGYIFEKYINQKQMGAYYTREDITEYMSKSTVVPYLLDSVRSKCRIAFENPKGPVVWDLLRAEPDRFIPSTLRHGVDVPLPAPSSQRAGVDELPPDVAYPGETWREVSARRDRYKSVAGKLGSGAVRSVGDLVSLNIDLRQFAQDVIESCDGTDLLRAFWRTIERVTILDPTCGSGAFLFAALNILEPLYEACLERMEAFVHDADHNAAEGSSSEKLGDFREVLNRLAEHPNRRYFIFKSIILNNLFGVDIMEEAVEICKLRLFLKLAAQVEPDPSHPNLGIEPLPDIDFNIKAGNTLVGFARYADVEQVIGGKIDFDNSMERISTKAADLQNAFDLFRTRQMEGDNSVRNKTELRSQLADLQNELNHYLALEYGVDSSKTAAYTKWIESSQPFHWFVEFYGIMGGGGFDVVIGNPPYVQWGKVTSYRVIGYQTGDCPDIYAACVERSLQLVAEGGAFAMILPISFQFSSDFEKARQVCRNSLSDIWISAFSRNPAALFSAGLGVRSSICIGRTGQAGETHIRSTTLNRWIEVNRSRLFANLSYEDLPTELQSFGWPRLDSFGLAAFFTDLVQRGGRIDRGRPGGSHEVRFKAIALYYISAFVNDPPSYDEAGRPIEQTRIGSLRFRDKTERDLGLVVALGKIALLWWAATGDDFDITVSGLGSTPLNLDNIPPDIAQKLLSLNERIVSSLDQNVIYTKYAGKWMGNYDIKYIRTLTDEADRLLLQAFGLEDHWEDIELAYERFMKATGERPGTVREVPNFLVKPKVRRTKGVN